DPLRALLQTLESRHERPSNKSPFAHTYTNCHGIAYSHMRVNVKHSGQTTNHLRGFDSKHLVSEMQICFVTPAKHSSRH
ncbi:hypothetical protein M9458_054820, partial [Cirrhinus mrigala]